MTMKMKRNLVMASVFTFMVFPASVVMVAVAASYVRMYAEVSIAMPFIVTMVVAMFQKDKGENPFKVRYNTMGKV